MSDTSKKILIIDDDIDLVEANRAVLEASGYRVVAAYSPGEGAKKIRGESPDLVILDVLFGRDKQTDGFQLARQFRLDPELAAIPILMITSVNREYPEFSFSSRDGDYVPVDAVLDKPVQSSQLVRNVRELLDRGTSCWVSWSDTRE